MSEPAADKRRSPRQTWRRVRWARRAVQAGAFLLFVVLLFATQLRVDPPGLADLFFRFDPLTSFGAMLAARTWIPHLSLALVTLAFTLLLGRVWCGWICPLGTLLGWLRFPSGRRLAARVPPTLRGVKYLLLGMIAVMAAFGGLALLVLDPITLLTRSAATSLLPALDWLLLTFERAVQGWGQGDAAVSWLRDTLDGAILPPSQPHYEQAIALVLLLLAVVLLNLLADRFWCRYLCPLGALLGLVARVQVLRPVVGDGCTACGACTRSCRLGAIEEVSAEREPAPRGRAGQAGASADGRPAGAERSADRRTAGAGARVLTSECTMCLDCLAACPAPDAMRVGSVRATTRGTSYDPGRREFVTASALGVGAILGLGGALLLGDAAASAATRPRLIRPPGAQDEAAFLARCLRCGECILVCPTAGLQPALGQGGLEAVWTPVLTPRLGHCDYACAACGGVCPSAAIPELDLATKRAQVLGVAEIDEARCLPWALGTPCSVCEEMCPVPEKAIVLSEPRLITHPDGTQDYVSRPAVVRRRCIGCGICENKCPVEGAAAIVVRRREGSGGRRLRRGQTAASE